VGLATNKVHQTDCVKGLQQIEPGSIDLVFADPPFNIGYEYDVYDDARATEEYLDWTRKWMRGVRQALKETGTFWLAIGDEYAAELKLIAQRELGFTCRSWVIWYYTFGVNCTRVFSRSHTHLLYFVKDAKNFTFNADNPAIRVPSARQLVYADGRANPRGRLPDNTWILRPQDAPNSFTPDHDTWYFPRVAGTFKEREGFHGCQMPEQLLGRIIRCCSNPMETVLDPFGGSGTTFAVAKKLGRQWIGFELSKDYVDKIKIRLHRTAVGGQLDGSADPLSSAPPTVPRSKPRRRVMPSASHTKESRSGEQGKSATESQGFVEGIVDAYETTHAGFSVDYMLADAALNSAFLDACKRHGLPGGAVEWNRTLLRIRKAGALPRLSKRAKRYMVSAHEMDPYSFAGEVAMQQLGVEFNTTLDRILCDPKLAARFDELAESFSPGYSSFQYRWAALALRKRARDARKLAKVYCEWLSRGLPHPKAMDGGNWIRYEYPGVYLLTSKSRQPLYVGEAVNLRRRLDLVSQIPSWQKLEPMSVTLIRDDDKRVGLQSILIRRFHPVMNLQSLAPDLEVVA
jgi:DNA modification methylase